MNTKIIINKDLFSPHNERLLAVVQVKRRTKKKIPFLATGGQRNYLTYICLSVTEKKPFRVSITKVKQFYGQSDFVKRSQWTIDQLQQVNGIDSSKDCPEFDLSFDNTVDQWVASSAGDKCTFIQVLHYSCQRYCSEKKPEFVNCQAKLLGESQAVDSVFFRCKVYLNRMKKEFMSHHGHLLRQGNSILHSAADSVTSAVQKASQALNERGERLGRAEERTADMMNSAEQFAVTAHKLAMKHKC